MSNATALRDNDENLGRLEHVLYCLQVIGTSLPPSFWYKILVPVTWTENWDLVSWVLDAGTR